MTIRLIDFDGAEAGRFTAPGWLRPIALYGEPRISISGVGHIASVDLLEALQSGPARRAAVGRSFTQITLLCSTYEIHFTAPHMGRLEIE
jgi:hypothetical protein